MESPLWCPSLGTGTRKGVDEEVTIHCLGSGWRVVGWVDSAGSGEGGFHGFPSHSGTLSPALSGHFSRSPAPVEDSDRTGDQSGRTLKGSTDEGTDVLSPSAATPTSYWSLRGSGTELRQPGLTSGVSSSGVRAGRGRSTGVVPLLTSSVELVSQPRPGSRTDLSLSPL